MRRRVAQPLQLLDPAKIRAQRHERRHPEPVYIPAMMVREPPQHLEARPQRPWHGLPFLIAMAAPGFVLLIAARRRSARSTLAADKASPARASAPCTARPPRRWRSACPMAGSTSASCCMRPARPDRWPGGPSPWEKATRERRQDAPSGAPARAARDARRSRRWRRPSAFAVPRAALVQRDPRRRRLGLRSESGTARPPGSYVRACGAPFGADGAAGDHAKTSLEPLVGDCLIVGESADVHGANQIGTEWSL